VYINCGIFYIFFLRFYENKYSDSTLAEIASNSHLKRRLDSYHRLKWRYTTVVSNAGKGTPTATSNGSWKIPHVTRWLGTYRHSQRRQVANRCLKWRLTDCSGPTAKLNGG
jgi:hypothetical protein